MNNAKPLTIGIDASNIRAGGGVTHLVELLRAAQPLSLGIDRVIIWGGSLTLKAIEERPWLEKRIPPKLDRGLVKRMHWQRYNLSHAAGEAGCDVLFVPGGSYSGKFHPVVSMSQNLLPFEKRELMRYGWSFLTLKFFILRLTQSRTFQHTEGVIFLTDYARKVVINVTGKLRGQTCIIPHGLALRFNRPPKAQRPITEYDDKKTFRILYVSSIDLYKHQWNVVEAVAALRNLGLPIVLDLVGPAYPPALKRLNKAITRVDTGRRWIHYHGEIPYSELHDIYAKADIGIWASTCETFGIILLEAMAAGLPIACSVKEPMPEVVGDAAVYFDPEQPNEISRALGELINSPQLRAKLALAAYQRVQHFSWQRCAEETFSFVVQIARQFGSPQSGNKT